MTATVETLWEPTPDMIEAAKLAAFVRHIGREDWIGNYQALWQWSVDQPASFWTELWRFAQVIGDSDGDRGSELEPALVPGDSMMSAKWFPSARLNYAENLLRERPREGEAIVFRAEDKLRGRLSFGEWYDQVSITAQALRAAGVEKGDRVAAVLPNCPQTIIAMLATASIGAIWSSCSPDFGVSGIVDRFGQIEPKVLFLVDGYYYNGKWIDCKHAHPCLQEQLASVERIVVLGFEGASNSTKPFHDATDKAQSWNEFIDGFQANVIAFERLPFQYPLFILFSSGTTNKPKCIVHSHGGTLLQHLKEHQLHADIKPGDRLFYFTTCGWMMWNWLVSALASGATLMLYDGSPFAPSRDVLFDYVDAEAITHFGTSAKYIDACQKYGLCPRQSHSLKSLRSILSTGSVLAPASFDYVYGEIKKDLCLSSISGGTDIISCFALGNPWLPVFRGELQCRGLAMNVAVYDDDGNEIRSAKGELVCKSPFPSQPIGFWNDENGEKYRRAYFDRFPNVWCQGDYVELTERNTMIFYGRSDAVLNPGGVRIGTAEIYRQVESLAEITECLAIGQDWQNDVRIVLFVRLQPGIELDEALIQRIKQHIRANTTPRHVPAKIIAVADIPRTKSGKIVELAVKKVVHDEEVNNKDALANPEALALFRELPELSC